MRSPSLAQPRLAGIDRTIAVTRAIERMRDSLGEPQPLADLARMAPFSPFHFHRLFRDATTMTPGRFLAALRMAEARRLLLHSRLTVTAIGAQVGYTSIGTFTTQFTRLVGAPPAHFRQLVRSLADVPAGDVLAGLDPLVAVADGRSLAVHPSAVDASGLAIVALRAPGGEPDAPERWALGAGSGRVRLAAPLPPGAYDARVLIVHPRVLLTEALVDDIPGSYLAGFGSLSVPSHGGPADPLEITMRRPHPTDPPMLAVEPLRRLAALATGGYDDGPRSAPAVSAPPSRRVLRPAS